MNEMSERHPDIFTDEEATAFLRLASTETLAWVRENFKLPGHKIGKAYLYHRDDLNACALRMFGKDRASAKPQTKGPSMKIVGADR